MTVTQGCPNDDTLAAWAGGELPAREAAFVAKHVDGCTSCRAIAASLLDLAGHGGASPELDAELPAQESELLQGRWVVGTLLHRGERSIVFEAVERATRSACVVKFAAGAAAPRAHFAAIGDGLSRVRSSSLPRMLAVVREATVPYWVLARAHGVRLDEKGPLSPARWERTASDLTAAVSRLSAAGLRHGAIDARRVLLEPDRAVLLGFSLPERSPDSDGLALAKLLAATPVRGTTPLKEKIKAIAESPGHDVLDALRRVVADV